MTTDATTPQNFWEKLGTWAIITLLAFSLYYVQKLEDRIEKHDTAIMALSVDKVSRPELKELEARLTSNISGIKNEILERMDWHFRHNPPKQEKQKGLN